ncbi:5-oxoprolinase subunit PxpB [Pseudoalteromonas piscicida]|uniref:5-oxoprolinase subunit PxpB n=1 Tax=Pseudoalteromonas piscicida TaxID=43662 RepID=UPI0030AD437D
MTNMSCYRLGEHAIVVDLPCASANQKSKNLTLFALKKWLDDSGEFVDVVPAKHSVTAYLKDPLQAQHWLSTIEQNWNDLELTAPKPTLHRIPVKYGKEFGQDFEKVACELGLTHQQLIDLHTSVEYQVHFMGFLPGFAYLAGLPEALHLPRKSTPITHVPKGSIAIADSYSAIYPCQSPGGWHLLGQTDINLFNPESEQVSLLQPGDIVRFVESSC